MTSLCFEIKDIVEIGFIYSTLGGVIQEIIINEGMNERYTKFHTFNIVVSLFMFCLQNCVNLSIN